ncbi:hypothetical protein [Rhodoferax sp. UBA5149]|uniref:hypothetical protein n=1 Tax=Rhodoferax sp. UBA5149 TaxID=1947379 RepID=UPI0025F3862A|nr:hypothetical protein [Rhodoferax sp. UBA5149]
MIQQAMTAAFQPHRIETLPSRVDALPLPTIVEEHLPFTVRLVRDEDDLKKAVHIRHSAYARHLPDFAETLKSPETADEENGVVVLLAESKLDGSALGTMRIETNQFKPLCLEQSVELPNWLKTLRLAEATRLGVTNAKGGRLVTTVLFKAFFQYCQQIDIEWMVIAGRAPVDRMYDRLLFKDVFPGMGYIPLAHASNLPHRVMSLKVDTVESCWAAAEQPLFDFFFRTLHPDLDIGGESQPYFPQPTPAFQGHRAAFPM